jgi:hypothetical protein
VPETLDEHLVVSPWWLVVGVAGVVLAWFHRICGVWRMAASSVWVWGVCSA